MLLGVNATRFESNCWCSCFKMLRLCGVKAGKAYKSLLQKPVGEKTANLCKSCKWCKKWCKCVWFKTSMVQMLDGGGGSMWLVVRCFWV